MTPTPKFDRPPVTETVLGVQFAPLPLLTVAQMGRFWADVEEAYPKHEIQPPLGRYAEEFTKPPMDRSVQLALSTRPALRGWFVDSDGTELIQVQHDWFIRNWRRLSAKGSYP